MKSDNPFDRRLEAQKNVIPTAVRDSAVFVTDTLDIYWAAAQAVFEEQATPEHAIAICKMLIDELPPQMRQGGWKAN